MNLAIQLVMNTLQIGAVYVLFALGLTLIFGVMKVINFAHGEFFSITALIISSLVPEIMKDFGWPLWLAYVGSFLASLVVALATATLFYWLGFQRFLRDLLGSFALSVGLLFLCEGVLLSIFGGVPRFVPPLLSGEISIFGGIVNLQRLLVFIVAFILTVLLYLFVKRSKLGKALRAVADDREAAMLQGIRYRWISFYGFLIGSTLAAVSGGLMAPVTALSPTVGDDYLVKAFIIIIIGGLGSVPGSIAGGFLIAMVESIGGYVFDLTTATLIMFGLVIAFLLLRPQGLAGNDLRLT